MPEIKFPSIGDFLKLHDRGAVLPAKSTKYYLLVPIYWFLCISISIFGVENGDVYYSLKFLLVPLSVMLSIQYGPEIVKYIVAGTLPLLLGLSWPVNSCEDNVCAYIIWQNVGLFVTIYLLSKLSSSQSFRRYCLSVNGISTKLALLIFVGLSVQLNSINFDWHVDSTEDVLDAFVHFDFEIFIVCVFFILGFSRTKPISAFKGLALITFISFLTTLPFAQNRTSIGDFSLDDYVSLTYSEMPLAIGCALSFYCGRIIRLRLLRKEAHLKYNRILTLILVVCILFGISSLYVDFRQISNGKLPFWLEIHKIVPAYAMALVLYTIGYSGGYRSAVIATSIWIFLPIMILRLPLGYYGEFGLITNDEGIYSFQEPLALVLTSLDSLLRLPVYMFPSDAKIMGPDFLFSFFGALIASYSNKDKIKHRAVRELNLFSQNPSIYGVIVIGLFFLVNFVLALLTGVIGGVETWIND